MKTRRRTRKWLWVVTPLVLLGGLIGFVGPWPVQESPSPAVREEAVALAAEVAEAISRPVTPASLTAGWAVKPYELEGSLTLAGYGYRHSDAATEPGEPLAARALSLQAGDAAAVILMADLLVVNEKLAREVRRRVHEALAPAPVPLLLFTATHTHSGPGGWGDKWVERGTVAGPYNPRVFDRLAETLTQAAVEAWTARGPAEIAFQQAQIPELLRNRSVSDGPVDGTYEIVAVHRKDSGALGVIAIFGGHATCLGRSQRTLSRDYPGCVVDGLEQLPGVAFAGFAAGCVGSHSCQAPGSGFEKANSVGQTLTKHAGDMLATAPFRDVVRMTVARLVVQTPPVQVRIANGWKLSPWLTSSWLDGRADFDVLRIDDQLWITLPVELSGMLSAGLREEARDRGIALTLTCFNGDYFGYLLPDTLYPRRDIYEAQMSFLGPSGGAFVHDVLKALIPAGTDSSLKPTQTHPAPTAPH